MSAALNRRDDGCASDLALDRWLLGELPGSDEGRKLEQHVRGCPSCGARLKALRSLYQTVPVAAAVPKQLKAAKPPRIDPATDGVMQVAILRDGLLVGTQVFTPGHYSVGSAADCDLSLDDLEPEHAQLYFRAGHTAVESNVAQMFVNGFPMKCATVRAIDEVCLGPYVLRVRVIQSRWEPPLKVVPPPPPTPPVLPELSRTEPSRRRRAPEVEAKTEVLTAPAGKRALRSLPIQLKAQLLWGQSILETAAFDGPLTPNAFDRWGVEPLRQHLLAEPVLSPAFRVHVPHGLDGALGDVELQLGESLRLEHDGLTLLLSVTEAPKKAPSTSWRQLPWTVMSMCALLTLAFAAFATFAPEPGDNEAAFTARPPPAIKALFEPKPPPPTPVAVAAADPVKQPAKHEHHEPPAHVRPPPPPDKHGMGGLPSVLKKLDTAGWKAIADKSIDLPMGHAKPAGPTAGLATGGSVGNALGLDTKHTFGIGAAGLLGAGKMGHGNLGKRGVLATLDHVAIHDPNGSGTTIDKQSIADAINKHLGEVSACYESSMMREGAFGGKLTLEWSIGPGGHVGSVKVANATVKSASVGACIMGKLKSWLFPSPHGPGSVTVSYPFLFHSSDFN